MRIRTGLLVSFALSILAVMVACRISESGPSAGGADQAVEIVEGETGIVVLVPDGAERASWDLYAQDATAPLVQAISTGTLHQVEPGRYTVTEYYNSAYQWAVDLTVEQGRTTRVHLGALRVTAPAGSKAGNWDLWKPGGEAPIDQAKSTEATIPVPAGTFVLSEYYNPRFVWAEPVVVEPGRITEVVLGAVRVIAPEGAEASNWDLWKPGGEAPIDQANSTGATISVPAGTFVLKEYYNARFVWRDDLEVAPGMVSEVALGAIRVASASDLNWDLWDVSGEEKLDEAKSSNVIVPVPAGTFTVKKYYTPEVLAQGVVVSPGQVAEVRR